MKEIAYFLGAGEGHVPSVVFLCIKKIAIHLLLASHIMTKNKKTSPPFFFLCTPPESSCIHP